MLEIFKIYLILTNSKYSMKTILHYHFSKKMFNLEDDRFIEFENPPYIPESKTIIDIDYDSFFDSETADVICNALEADENLLPYKTSETWNDEGVFVVYEFMNIDKMIKKQ